MFKLTIRTPYEEIFNDEVESLHLNTDGGDMQVFADHASITASIAFSPIEVKIGEKDELFFGRNGIFLFDNEKNEASILVNHCEKKSEISYQSVQAYADYITKQLEEGHKASEFQLKFLKGEKIAVEEQMKIMKD